MKKIIKILTLALTIVVILQAIPTNDTNILKNKAEVKKVEKTTFANDNALFDGIVSNKDEFSTLVKTDKGDNQYIVLRLNHPFYIRKLIIYLDKTKTCKNVLARFSKKTTFWNEFDDVEKVTDEKSVKYIFTGHNVLANYLSFVFAVDKKTPEIRIQEIEVYPEMDIRLKERWIKDNWITTDREAFNNMDTKIDTVKFLKYSKLGSINKFNASSAPVLEGELMAVNGLEPGTPYEYKTSVTDYNGNILEVSPRQFRTKSLSLAYNKKVNGTFNKHYNGNTIVKDSIVVTNGSTDINKGLAISGSLKRTDQYVVVDLEKSMKFSEVITIWRELGYSKDFSILVSNDQKEWNEVAVHQNGETSPKSRASGHPVRIVLSKFEPVNARYVKLLAKKGSAHYSKHNTGELELFELKVF